MNACCILKRPFDVVPPWTCPHCGEIERELSSEEFRDGLRNLRGKFQYSNEEVAELMRPVVVRADLIAKLEREIETTELGLSDLEVAVRRGWNSRTRELVRWLKEGEK